MNALLVILIVALLMLAAVCLYQAKRLRSLVNRNKAILRSIEYPVLVVDREGNVIRVLNHPPLSKYGYINNDRTFNIEKYIISPDEVEMRRHLLTHCIDNQTHGTVTVHTRTTNGSVRVINLSVAYNYGGNAIETSVDVTDYAEDLANKEVKYRAAITQLQMMLKAAGAMPWVMGPKEEVDVIGVNRSGLPDEYQAPEIEQLQLQDNDFAAIDEEYRDLVREKIADVFAGKVEVAQFDYKGRILKRMKDSIWFHTSCTPLTIADDGKVISVAGTTRIIENDKRNQAELQKAKQRAEANDRMKSMFLSSMSHEVRTPLNVILGFAKLLPTADDDEVLEYQNIIEKNGELLLNLVDDVLDMARIEAGEFKINREKLEINAVCDLAVSSLISKPHKGVALEFVRTMPDTYIVGDNKRIMQVLMQLTGNALKYTYKGRVTVRVELEGDDFVKVLVQDTGEGIASENIDKVFERFFRASSLEVGTGLGLPICKSLVVQMGGKIGVQSVYGEGSTFWFTIPRA